MLKTKKSKIIIGAVAILAVLAASSIWVMSAIKSNSVDDFGYEALAQAGNTTATLTQLDQIIKDSLTEGVENYKVYVITPSGEDVSVIEDFFQNDEKFGHYVVNDNRTIDETMSAGWVTVTTMTVGQLNGMSVDEMSMELGKADLIYLYASTPQSYLGNNAIGEDLYNYLHNYAFGLNKPLIINCADLDAGSGSDIGSSQPDPSVSMDSNVYQLTTVTFKNSWKRTNTFNVSKWKNATTSAEVEDIFESYFGNSLYIPYSLTDRNVPDGFGSWEAYWKRNGIDADNDGNPDSVLNILYIHGDSADHDAEAAAIQAVGEWMIGEEGRAGRAFSTVSYAYLPASVNVVSKSAEELESTTDLYDAETGNRIYDYVFIAPDNYPTGKDLSADMVAALSQLSKEKAYILFGTLEESKQSSGNTGSTNTGLNIDVSTNYGKLLDLSITSNGYAKKNNVLVVGVEYMNTLAKEPAKNPTKIAQLVALINKSTYRTHAGSGSGGGSGSISTTAYRVLELQPCYPIDLTLARGITAATDKSRFTTATGQQIAGNYYTIPANVLNTNEIDNYLDENGKMTSEYYQWDLSKAKISYALNLQGYSGITPDQIDLVQMSTEEYITAKADVSDAYDLIYIGGNMSALRSSSTYGVVNWGVQYAASTYKTAFSMYSHNNSELITWPNHGRITLDSQYSIALGNDITYDRLVELKKYIDAGMPIVFSNEIWGAYEKACNQKYKNKYMDPDSNMFKLCAYAEAAAKKDGNTSVLTNWEVRESYNAKMGYAANSTDYKYYEDYFVSVETRVENENGIYGTTDSVTVFGTDEDNRTLSWQLWACINGVNTNQRPKFSVTTTAISYVEGDSSTELEGRDVKWDVSLLSFDSTHKYTAYILEDKDDNGVFDITGEQAAAPQAFIAGEASLSYSYPKSDFGAFYWKLLVVDETTGASASCSDITVFKRLENQPKKSATVLEIIELKQSQCSSSNPSSPDSHTFYLDTNYQQSSGNPFLYSSFDPARGAGAYDEYGWAPFPNDKSADNPSDSGPIANYSSNKIGWATRNGMGGGLGNYTFGKYQPSLSIGRYDATTDLEDRAYNYMSLVEDDYDFTLDIMYMDDIQYFSEKAHNSTEAERAANLEKAEKAKENYDAYLTEGSVSYNELKKVEDVLVDCLKTLKAGNDYTCSNGTVIRAADFNLYDIDNIIESKNYFRIFFLNNDGFKGAADGDNLNNSFYALYKLVYTPYTNINDIKIKYYREYRYYSMLAYGPKEYLTENYDVIVVGFSDPYMTNMITPFSDVEAKDLQDFATAGGSLLLTHDVITKSNETKLNKTGEYLRDFAGQNAFSGLTAEAGTGSNGYSKYTSIDKDRYFLTNFSAIDGVDLGPASSLTGSAWDTAVGTWANMSQVGVRGGTDWSGVSSGISLMGLTDAYNGYYTSQAFSLRYKYAEFNIEELIVYNIQVTGPLNVSGTTRAEAVNRGVVTTYPFYIATDLRVSATHPQSFTLDLENKNVTVWYTLAPDNKKRDGSVAVAGRDSGSYQLMKNNSSLMAASPKDGADNYYIYSIGNTTYCGAGQALITGYKRDNNDERRLFLNVLLHMAKVRDGVDPKPEIVLYDPDGKTKAPGSVVKRDAENDYYIEVLSDVSYPEFGFGLENISSKVKDVEVFYDLDYGMTGGIYDAEGFDTDAFMDNEDHVRIPFPKKNEVIDILNSPNGVYIMTKEDHPALVTSRRYFDGKNNIYGGKYTYIVVRVTLENNTVLTRRIKVMLTRNLLDLT